MAKLPEIKVTARVIVDNGEVAALLDDIVRRLERIEQAADPWWRRWWRSLGANVGPM